MKNSKKLTAVLYLIAGVCFFVSALFGKNYTFIPIGICFIILSIVHSKKDVGNGEDK